MNMLTTIIINARERRVFSKKLSYADILRIVAPNVSPSAVYTITYLGQRDHNNRRLEGSLIKGQSVVLEEGMIINAFDTGNA